MGRVALLRWHGHRRGARALSRILVCGLAFGCLWATPADTKPLPQRPAFHHLDLPTGFLPDTDLAIAQDADGFLWFGTQRGLFRYDGYRMLLFPRVADSVEPERRAPGSCDGVTDLRVEDDGLWIATACGVEHLGLASERVRRWWLEDPIARATTITRDRPTGESSGGGWWVGTTDGLRRLDADRSTWDTVPRDPWPETIRTKPIRAVLREPGSLWVGTSEGLYRSTTAGETFASVPFAEPPTDPAYHLIEALHRDSRGMLWVTTADGLHRVVESEGALRLQVELDLPGNCVGEPRQWHYGMASDTRGAFWFSSGGTLVSRRPDDTVDCYSRFQKDPQGLGGSAGNLFVDRGGTLWVATERSLDRLAPAAVRAWDYAFDDSVEEFGWQASWSLGLLDPGGTVWIGTNLGLFEIDPDSHTLLRHFMADDPELLRIVGRPTVGNLPDFTILALARQDDGTLWAGTAEGLARLPTGAGRFESVAVPNEPSSGPRILALAAEDDQLWVGTGQALHRLSTSEGVWNRITLADGTDPTAPFAVRELGVDPRGRLWIATDHRGLLTLEPGALEARVPVLRSRGGGTKRLRRVNTFYPENPSTLWIGTEDGGLDRIEIDRDPAHGDLGPSDPEGFEITSPPWSRELAGRPMRGVARVGDELWLLTARGLSQVDTRTGRVRHLGEREGLREPDSAFGLLALDRRLLVTGSALYELSLGERHEVQLPPVRFTGLSLSSQRRGPRAVDPDSPLERALQATSRLELAPDQTVITFEFAALGYGRPEDLRYHYRLEGADQPWLETQGDRPFVTYAPLAPGRYRLRARAALDGIESTATTSPGDPSTEAELEVVVRPPWWRSPPAYASYLLVGLAALSLWLATQRRELRREQLLNRKLRRLDSLKDELLANTSHELRTPLFGITGLAEGLRDGTEGPISPGVRQRLDDIVASGRRLADRVDEILDLASLRRQEVALALQPLDVASLFDLVLETHRPPAVAKQLELACRVEADLPAVLGDPQRLRQVFRHLVENAIKFSQRGTIELVARRQGNDHIRFEVRDQGIGMTSEDLETVFNDFEQVRGDATRHHGGTGLGLAICRRLVELHGGTIRAESTPQEGSRIVVVLSSTPQRPIRAVAAEVPETATESEATQVTAEGPRSAEPTAPESTVPESTVPESTAQQSSPQRSRDLRPTPVEPDLEFETSVAEVLLVDDEPINRIIVESYFARTTYRLTSVEGGAEALDLLERRPFDLILLDVMMPGMSGFEVCRRIRERHPVESLPILFLSARTAVEDRIEGLASGGTDYLTKPISRGELLVRVEQALTVSRSQPALEPGPGAREREIREPDG